MAFDPSRAKPMYAADRVAILAGVLMLAFTGPSLAADVERPMKIRILESQTRLARVLLGKIADGQAKGTNLIVSPASLAGMLTAIDLGADDALRRSIGIVLQIEPGEAAGSEADALRTATAKLSEVGELASATRIVFSPANPASAEALTKLHDAGVEAGVSDLRSSDALAVINDWVDRETHGKVSHIVDHDSAPDDTGFLALNALYFKDVWRSPFDKRATAPADFQSSAETRIRTGFMHSRPGKYSCVEDDKFIAVDLPFASLRFSMVVITTKRAPVGIKEFDDHVGWLSGRDFETREPAIVSMPQLTVDARTDLIKPLVALGLDQNGSFPKFTALPLRLSKVLQIVKLLWNEEGAEVAAVTAGMASRSLQMAAPAFDIVVDKPFLYGLRDTETGLLVVAGYVAKVDGALLAPDDTPKSARSH